MQSTSHSVSYWRTSAYACLGASEEYLDIYAKYLEVFKGLCWLLRIMFAQIFLYALEHTS